MADPRYHFEPLLYRAITPIHVGSGQDVGIVDLPVIRERTTNHPFLPGSGIRGAMRDACEEKNPKLTPRLFGDDREGQISSGCLSVLDAHLLLLPVRSVPGIFHWITCPFVLRRFRELCRDLAGFEPTGFEDTQGPPRGQFLGGSGQSTYLEEYLFEVAGGKWSWAGEAAGVSPERVLLLHDVDFTYFATQATIVRQRNRLSTAKTVVGGNLFSVEMVPAQSCFCGFLGATRERLATNGDGDEREQTPLKKDDVAEGIRELLTGTKKGSRTHLTLGGDESVGLGLTRVEWRTAGPTPADPGGVS